MHTSAKGDLGVVKTIARLTELSWNVGVLITEHMHYDLLAEKNGKMIRVQVKYAPINTPSGICIDLRCIWANSKGCKVKLFDSSDYDVLAVYCPDRDKCYFVPVENVIGNTHAITLSLERNPKCVRYADDFLEI